MRFNDDTWVVGEIGMPLTHKKHFLDVAQEQKCVIMVRKTGPTCHGLLAEGYDTKGYRIHGKSCDWGPMAGFVMRDPRLNKYGLAKAGFNHEKHMEALYADKENQGWNASTTPLILSRDRIEWLMNMEYIRLVSSGNNYIGVADKAGVKFNYVLIPEGGGLYSVCFDHSRGGPHWVQDTGNVVDQPHPSNRLYEPMLAMTNPPDHGLSTTTPHLKAVTGDYDLFAVWPYENSYNAGPGGADHRPLGTVRGSTTPAERQRVEHLESQFTASGQGTKLGNITNRIYMICQLINSRVGRNVLWHSDEAARPFLDDVDLPVIAFTPGGAHIGSESIGDFKRFIEACRRYSVQVTLSNAWTQEPSAAHPNRLGEGYARFVPVDGVRIIAPDWYNA
ncbi:anthrax toxin-like adenylyl cyclase domain-containing protein [Oxalobacteraceae bacterium A2-2]